MFYPRQPLSAYLVQPNISHQKNRTWEGFQTTLVTVRRRNPQLLNRSLIALAVWCMCIASLQSVTGHLETGSGTAATQTGNLSLASSTGAGAVRSGGVPAAIHAAVLPSGPSGQLLPPGTMVQEKTYQNSYANGQCTWYVAGRRQIPANWGNAVSWYFHAASSGWSIGTLPAVAAIAWTPAGRYGHVALVEQVSADGSQVYVSEMNYRGVGVKSFRWVRSTQFKYIY